MIFLDFDGVIKDSVDVKTQAFMQLFDSYGTHVVELVKSHHESNGGMSRFDKIPLYLSWVNEEANNERVNQICKQFSQISFRGVINAHWVPGVEEFLRINPYQHSFVLVSATPQEELEKILQEIGLQDCFKSIFGAPTNKKDAIRMMLENQNINPKNCLMIGDARIDLDAAEANQVPFLLRWHSTNANVFADYKGPKIKDFTEL